MSSVSYCFSHNLCFNRSSSLYPYPRFYLSSFLPRIQLQRPKFKFNISRLTPGSSSKYLLASSFSSTIVSSLEALIFDCDGVILESEDLHRRAYNDAFAHFHVRTPSSSTETLVWDSDFYDELQNRIGGGKPKMRWYFKQFGWPTSTVFEIPPENDSDRAKLIDTIQDWKTERYKEIIKSGTVEPRPGVLRLMDEARAAGIKLAVCSAATKSSVILCLENLIGVDRFNSLDCFLAGDDVQEKKPDPSIYLTAAKAATKAGMSCVVTYTDSTSNQDFGDAVAIFPDLGNVRFPDLVLLVQNAVASS